MNLYKLSSFLCAVTVAAFASLPAAAATFYYDAYGGFISGTDVPSGTGTFANDPDTATGGGAFDVGADADARMTAGRFVDVSWGSPQGSLGPYAGQSGLALSKVNNGTVVTDGVPVDFGRLTHFNRPISDPATEWLTTVQLDWTLQLYATPGDAVSDVNPIKTIDLTFTIYNWETPNVPASNPAYQVSFDGGATWTTGPAGVCPGSYPVGTLVVGPLGKVYRSEQPDRPDNPVWNGQCADAHIYEAAGSNSYQFTHNGRDYVVELSGFYNMVGVLTGTFWACEANECFGTVKMRIRDQTTDAQIPTLSEWALVALAAMMVATGLLVVRRRS